MADLGLSVAQTLFPALNCSELKQICAVWGYKSQLEDLNKTVTTIKRVLLDAESKVLTNEAQGYIEELKDALYEADDLFDEFVTLLELNQLQKSTSKRSEFFQKVRCFFSSDKNQVSHAFRMFHRVKKIQKKLNAIVDNHQKFSLGVDDKAISMRREETCSYINVKDVIGRDDDKNAIIDKLLEYKDQHVHFLTIVGVGGLGKTTLAQLVYNDEKLKQEFRNLMFWVCVSDQDKTQFDVKSILCKILELITHQKSFEAFSLETVQIEFQRYLKGKKYLLVLDDVWNEDRVIWDKLEALLMIGQGGSRVLVTTRSENTAKIIRNGCTHNLKGLSRDNSWKLFKMTAFDDEGSNQRCVNHIKMMDIEEKIVGKCNNNPLAIKVMGSLLYGQDINKWRSFEESRLAKINNGDNQIMSVLKLSYYNLQPSLKSCFSYCAVFPKDFEINKVLLINLWKALGYIEPLNEGQSVEDVAEEHFKILLRRCFFHDVKKDECDEIESVKIHDLLHDVAQEVVGGEFQVLNSVDYTLGDRTRHVSIFDKSCFEASSGWSSVRKLIALVNIPCYYNMVEIPKDIKVGNWKSLRVLELACLGRGISLNSIGKLQHLRYLDLSRGDFEELPNSIAKLHNLQTLILDGCVYLRHLPHDFISLIKLSHLSLGSCMRLTGMPLGLDKLTRLRLLTDFVVGRKKNITEKQSDDELKDLGTLTNLTGSIWIEIGENYKNVQVMKDMSEGYLSKIADLKEVKISMGRESVEAEVAEDALEKLEPHPNLKKLVLNKYAGRTIPWWRRPKDNSPTVELSNLVKVKIIDCDNLVSLPSFCKLHFLKLLELRNLKNLEYMETRSSLPEASDTTFFPSLETLQLQYCSKWEGGWFREEGLGDAHYGSRGGILSFPCLSTLDISRCLGLMSFSFPPCQSLQTLEIRYCLKLEGLPEWINCLSSLQSLTMEGCSAIKSLPEGIQTLTSLQSLKIEKCPGLNERCRELHGLDWPKIQHIPNLDIKPVFESDSDSD